MPNARPGSSSSTTRSPAIAGVGSHGGTTMTPGVSANGREVLLPLVAPGVADHLLEARRQVARGELGDRRLGLLVRREARHQRHLAPARRLTSVVCVALLHAERAQLEEETILFIMNIVG